MSAKEAMVDMVRQHAASKRKPPRKRKAMATEDFQTYDLKRGASRRDARYYSKGGVRPGDKPRPD